jgi:N-acetylmuramoyl-L-alanine amidase
MEIKTGAMLLAGVLVVGSAATVSAQPARDLYSRALAQERTVRDAASSSTLRQIRNAVAGYERVVRRYPSSGYADNALWQAGHLSLLAFERFGQESDRRTGQRLLAQLKSEYPSSSLVGRLQSALAQFDTAKPNAVRTTGTAVAADRTAPAVESKKPVVEPAKSEIATRKPEAEAESEWDALPSVTDAIVRGITRTSLEDGVRVSIELDRELSFRQEPLENPRRLFFDLKNARPSAALQGGTLKFEEDIVREIRVGRHPKNVTRVVMDTEGTQSYSVFTLYNPFRVIIDFKRTATAAPATVSGPSTTPGAVSTSGPTLPAPKPVASAPPPPPPPPLPTKTSPAASLPAPTVPSANADGHFSIARQLGLGVSRVVIDAGHGGHDPGAKANGLSEAELTLDVAVRLKRLLEKQPGIEVVMTRETDVFIPLEERTAIANREGADLFLSIHANASRNQQARGVETYFLNFATNPEAEAVAARENSASGRTMHSLPSIVRAIALNNKIDESRDFAATVQKSMISRLEAKNKQVRNLGVKQAPFVVLIGAGMPSVLAEISFVTHKQEGTLLKTPAYRQTIAEALQDAILKYQRSLKTKSAIAAREE